MRDLGIGMIRIMVEQEELFYVGANGQFHDVVNTAMAPSDMFCIFGSSVLSV